VHPVPTIGSKNDALFFFILDPCRPARNVCGVLAEVRRGEWWSSGTWSSTPPPPSSSAQAGLSSLGANFSKLKAL
jgi:hypothetical protein